MGHPTWKVPSWLQWSALARAIAGRIRRSDTTQETTRWYQGLIGPQNAEGWRRTQGDIGAMKREAERHGAQFCMAVLPILYGLERGYAFAEVHSALTDTAAQHNAPAIDLLPVLEGQPSASLWVHPVDMHPNARAHGLMAEPLAEFVVAQLRKP